MLIVDFLFTVQAKNNFLFRCIFNVAVTNIGTRQKTDIFARSIQSDIFSVYNPL